MNLVEYKVPHTIETKDQLTLGNYIAFRCSGWYNGGKVSWHVIRVIWIVGTFDRHNNKECVVGNAVAKQLGLDTPISVHGGGVGDIEYCYIIDNDYGHMSKRDARKLMLSDHAEHDSKTISFTTSLDSEIGIKKVIC